MAASNNITEVALAVLHKNVCIRTDRINPFGIFVGSNPLDYSVPLLLLQLSLAPSIILLSHFLLKPLGQPVMISQIIGGIIIGPSFLGRIPKFTETVFPLRGLLVLDTYSIFGSIFYHFLIGLQMDPWSIFRSGRKEISIGISSVFVPLILSVPTSILMTQILGMSPDLARALPVVSGVECMLAFPVVAAYLTELKLLNSEFGRIALSSSMISGLISFSLVTSSMVREMTPGKFTSTIRTFLYGAALVFFILLVLRPALMWMAKQIPEGQKMKEEHSIAILVSVLAVAFLSKVAGLHILFGPFVYGMALPAGPPLGSALVQKLDFFTSWMIMPVYFVELGLQLDLFSVPVKNFVIIQSAVLLSCMGKFLGAFLASLHNDVTFKDALLLGLTMNVQGVFEISMFRMIRDTKGITTDSFIVMCTSLLFVTGAATPLIRYLYESRRYEDHMRRTIQHLLPNAELRVLACLYNQENVPGIIHLLKASNPTKQSPIGVYVVHLVELVGRATPLLISHKHHGRHSSTLAASRRIINVFRRYEETNEDEAVSINPFTAVSPYAVMHNDVCTLAFQKKISIIIIPFHKHLDADSGSVSSNPALRTVNHNVLSRAPCSVGILLDRGLLGGFRFVLANWLSYHVAVMFIGGPDDREALAYGVRMFRHPNIKFTVVRVLSINEPRNFVRDRGVDDEMLNEIRLSLEDDERFEYVEEVVNDRLEFIEVIHSMERNYQLVMFGRNHSLELLILLELIEWDEEPDSTELGVIGDLFASSNFGGKTTLLAVQQQRKRRRQHSRNKICQWPI